nr:cytochrome c-type biogenesis protein [Xaviernesmea oryzae]
MRFLLLLLALLGGFSFEPALAVNPEERLSDPALEARARALSAQLRCMVCQNQSIDDSNAELAKDLRLIVRERLATGASDDAVLDYVVSRYGEFVLLKPRVEAKTLLLWGAPLLLLAGGALGLFIVARRRRVIAPVTALTDAERTRLDDILRVED